MTDGGDWAAYASAAQRLGALRRAERERTSGRRRSAAAAREQVADLSDKLVAQQADLVELARTLRLPAPTIRPAGRSEVGGPARLDAPVSVQDRLARARQCLHEANVAADTADDLGDQPALLPHLRPRVRNAVVYAGASLLGLIAQLIMIGLSTARVVTSTFTATAWSLCGFPAIAFFLGYLAVGVLCRPRSSSTPVERSPRMGALICVASLPVYVLASGLLGF